MNYQQSSTDTVYELLKLGVKHHMLHNLLVDISIVRKKRLPELRCKTPDNAAMLHKHCGVLLPTYLMSCNHTYCIVAVLRQPQLRHKVSRYQKAYLAAVHLSAVWMQPLEPDPLLCVNPP